MRTAARQDRRRGGSVQRPYVIAARDDDQDPEQIPRRACTMSGTRSHATGVGTTISGDFHVRSPDTF